VIVKRPRIVLRIVNAVRCEVVRGMMYQSMAYCVNFGCRMPSRLRTTVSASAGISSFAYGLR
jgi:hypothetical protein